LLEYVATNALEQGLLYAFMVLGVLLSFNMLGFPDLTVEGSYPLGGAVAARLLVEGVDPGLASLLAALAGAAAGAGTGLVHTKLRINNILAGILTTSALFTLMLRVMGRPNTPLLAHPSVVAWVLAPFGLRETARTTIVCVGLLVLAARLAMGWFLRTDVGLTIRATGNNERMIRGLGVDTDLTKVLTLAISNGLVALTGALVAQNQGFADVTMGIGALVGAVASIIIGQTLFGDRGLGWLLSSVIVGSLVYRALLAAALRLGMPPTDLKLVTAALVLVALALPTIRARHRPAS
jgi:putative tryptophan/tyrosine transport system permease protein